MYKMPFAASKILGEITFFYEDFGTDKEFMDDKGVPKNVGRLKDFVAEYKSTH